jgi:hypothetical protein
MPVLSSGLLVAYILIREIIFFVLLYELEVCSFTQRKDRGLRNLVKYTEEGVST